MQAVSTCMLRSLTLPEKLRHDRGPEMTNALWVEVVETLGLKETLASGYRPMEVGQGETIHREVNKQIAMLLGDLARPIRESGIGAWTWSTTSL